MKSSAPAFQRMLPGVEFERLLVQTAQRSAPRFSRVAQPMQYKPMGVFFSEALALVAAAELVGATHLIESGTAQGQSTELLARYFRSRLNITTIDADATYGLFEKTKRRLAKHPSIRCLRGDSFVVIPQILRTLPSGSRALVFVDGPKGRLGRLLALRSLKHSRVALVAMHDTAEAWDAKLHHELINHTESLLETSLPPFRTKFFGLDHSHNESRIVTALYERNPEWKKSKIPQLLSHGHGLWLAGRSKVIGAKGPFTPRVYVALACDLGDRHPQIPGLIATIGSLLANTLRPRAFTIFVFVSEAAAARVQVAVACLQDSGVLRGAELRIIELDTATRRRFPLLRDAIDESTLVNYVRFYLPKLLPKAVGKVLWVDIDGLVLGDVRTLMSQVFNTKYSSALLAIVPKRRRGLTPEIGNLSRLYALDGQLHSLVTMREHAFNAGFIVLNLQAWRDKDVTAQLEAMIGRLSLTGAQRCGHDKWSGMSTNCDSQTPLVLVMRSIPGSLEKLHTSWNVDGLGWKSPRLTPEGVPRRVLCEARYLHWSGSGKPWSRRKAPRGTWAAVWRRFSDWAGLGYDPKYDPARLCDGRHTTDDGHSLDWTGRYVPLSTKAASADLFAAIWWQHASVSSGVCLTPLLDRLAPVSERAIEKE